MRTNRGPRARTSPGGVSAAFSPLTLSPHAWYRADDVILSGSSITTWTDKSGNSNDLTQGVGSAQPTQVDRYGQKCASLDGGDDVKGAFHAALTQPFTYAFVGEVTNFAAARTFLDSDDGTNRLWVFSAATSGALGQYAGVSHVGQTYTAAQVAAVCGEINGASSSQWLDDWTDGAVDSGNAGTHAADGLTIGRNFVGTTGMIGFFSELIIVNRSLSTAERASIGDYYTARYTGLTVTT